MAVESCLVYGPPGSGKTTISQSLSEKFGMAYLSVGEITRREISQKSALGQRLSYFLESVQEYPTELISELMEKHIIAVLEKGGTFIMDGFPKYANEAEAFIEMIKRHNIRIEKTIVIDLSLEESVRRIESRYICSSCQAQATTSGNSDICQECGGVLIKRDDDSEEILRRRRGDYGASIRTVLKIMEPHVGEVIHINGDQPADRVLSEISSIISVPE